MPDRKEKIIFTYARLRGFVCLATNLTIAEAAGRNTIFPVVFLVGPFFFVSLYQFFKFSDMSIFSMDVWLLPPKREEIEFFMEVHKEEFPSVIWDLISS